MAKLNLICPACGKDVDEVDDPYRTGPVYCSLKCLAVGEDIEFTTEGDGCVEVDW